MRRTSVGGHGLNHGKCHARCEWQVFLAVQLHGAGVVVVADTLEVASGSWTVLLDTEDRRFSLDPTPASITRAGSETAIEFARPGAIVLRWDITPATADA